MPRRENRYLDQMPEQRRPDQIDAHRALLERADFLLPRDRLMVELALKNQLTMRQLAQVMSIPAGTVSRKLRRLINRLCDPIVIALLSPGNPLPQEHRQLALEFMLQGRPVPELAETHRLSSVQVRRMLDYVRGWHRGVLSAGAARATGHPRC